MIYFYYFLAAILTGCAARWILSLHASVRVRVAKRKYPSEKIVMGLTDLGAGIVVLFLFWGPLIAFMSLGWGTSPSPALLYGLTFVASLWLSLVIFPIERPSPSENVVESKLPGWIAEIPVAFRIFIIVLFVLGVIVLKNVSDRSRNSSLVKGVHSEASAARFK